MGRETNIIRKSTEWDSQYGSIGTPLYLTSNFRFIEPGRSTGFDYTRSGNPTRSALEEALASLEGGAGAVATSTGMSAISVVLSHFAVGSHIIATNDCYGGTARLLKLLEAQGKIEVSFVDLGDREAVHGALRPTTRCLWIETPSNPLLRYVGIELLADWAKTNQLLTVVDNTFLSPYFLQPLALGADVVVHSTTKWINGHSDVCGGAIIAKDRELSERFYWLANAHGATTGAFDSWLVLRGLKTLSVRMKQHELSAQALAEFLSNHSAVAEVFYPGLLSHPSHLVAASECRGFGGVISFRLKCAEDVNTVLGSTNVFSLAESLGGVESLIEHPATMSHASMDSLLREAAGITDDIIRISVGLEDIEDLIADLEYSLSGVKSYSVVNRVPEAAHV